MDLSALERNYQAQMKAKQPVTTAAPKSTKKKKNFWLDQISTVGGIAGGVAGSVLGTPLLGVAGAGAGSALGQAIEDALMGQKAGDIAKDSLREGAIGAVFGAGPIKVLKGTAGAGIALAKGAGIAGAKQAAGKAATTPLRQYAGKAALNAADDLALKSFKINDSTWLNAFKKNIGEDAGTFARRVGLVGQAPEQIVKNIHEPLQEFYKQAIAQTKPIPKSEIAKGLKSAYEPLLNSVAQSEKSIGLQVKSQADDILKALPDQVNASDAYDYKKLFDSLVDRKLTDSSGKLANNVNKKIADVFRSSINSTASKSGVIFDANAIPVKGIKATDLKSLGKELQGIQEFVEKAGVKENVGRGKNLAGLMNVIALTGGGSMGGVPGAAVALGATNALGSKTAANIGTNALSKYGGKLAATEGGNSVKGMVGRLGTVGVLSGLANQAPQQPASLEDALMNQDLLNSAAMPNSMNMPNNVQSMQTSSALGSQYSQDPYMSSGYAQEQTQSPYPKENLLYDLRRDPANSAEYIKLYKQYDEIFGAPEIEAPKPLNQSQQERADLINALGLTENAVNAGSINYGPIGSRVEGIKSFFNKADPETLAYQNTVDGLRAAITKARAGASLTDGELKLLQKYTPSSTDTEQVVRSKLAQLRALYGYQQPTGGATLEDAILQSQGAYY